MKKIILIIALILSAKNYAQVAISPSYRGADDEFKKGEIEAFKKTTTVFVLSNIYDKAEYVKILKEAWTVTPFLVVDFNDFNVVDYANGNFSIAKLYGDIIVSSKGTVYTHNNLILRNINPEKFEKNFIKLKKGDKHYSSKLESIFIENSTDLARVPLCSTNSFLIEMMKSRGSDEKASSLYEKMYTEQCFTNANLGMLKNYFQQISLSLTKEEHYGLYDDFSRPEIKDLKDKVLYIPEVYKMEYNPWKMTEKLREEKEVKELLEDYKYKYEFISDTDLEQKILSNEEIFYLRYVSMNGNKYLQVVNGITGDPVYYSYGALTYNIKDNDFDEINNEINKAIKKTEKGK